MSETVRYKGKLILEQLVENETLEDKCKKICDEAGLDGLNRWCDTYKELLVDELYNEYIILDEKLYRIESKKKGECDYFAKAEYDKDGNISFHTMFYNGGCSLSEAIEDAYEKLKKENRQ